MSTLPIISERMPLVVEERGAAVPLGCVYLIEGEDCAIWVAPTGREGRLDYRNLITLNLKCLEIASLGGGVKKAYLNRGQVQQQPLLPAHPGYGLLVEAYDRGYFSLGDAPPFWAPPPAALS